MKISIKNFKSIGSLVDYELALMTILSGNNSIGKSSFIQLLLILKQTLEIESAKLPFQIQGKYYTAKNQIDLIKDKQIENKLEIAFSITKDEIDRFKDTIQKSTFDAFPQYTCTITFVYGMINHQLCIERFALNYQTPDKDNFVRFETKDNANEIIFDTNNTYFVKGIYDEPKPVFTHLTYSGFFPSSYEARRIKFIENPKNGKSPLVDGGVKKEYLNLGSIRSFLETFFKELYYIGPLRTEPKDNYPSDFSTGSIGIKGENLAFVLDSRKDDILEVLIPTFESDQVIYTLTNLSLINATNYWVCDVFNFAKLIYVRDDGDSYSIILKNNNDVETSIKHVGFGISQILPIIIQGLLLNKGGTLILEQPEIHLHPKAQSLLFDFLLSLTLQGKYVIIETHSDHFITRMRRRIAEDEESQLNNKIKLTFIEQADNNLAFKTIKLDEFGITDIFPEDFIERPDNELKALLKAQMKKRISQSTKQ